MIAAIFIGVFLNALHLLSVDKFCSIMKLKTVLMNLRLLLLVAFTTLQSIVSYAQIIGEQDSFYVKDRENKEVFPVFTSKIIVPAALIGYGVAALKVKGLQQVNENYKETIQRWDLPKSRLDNFSQFAPVALVYGLDLAGVKARHNFKERTLILASSQVFVAAFVLPLKYTTHELRPDSTNDHSFPSGHTAVAFSTAQFMFREYKDTNFLLGISGYSFAVFTGVYRTINNKHWLSDVAAGAGFGILSTELAYWVYPKIANTFGNKGKRTQTMVLPFYQNKVAGLNLVMQF